ncbi:MAG: RES domain-containing protein [Noviherbaspirillum sp.]
MADAAAHPPLPPADLDRRHIPEKQLNLAVVDLFRIHRKIHSPLFYNRKSTSPVRFRWDSATDAFGVLYAAPELATCLAEAIVRSKLHGSLVIEDRELEERTYSRLGCAVKPVLRLADLTRELFAIGADMQILSTSQYDIPNVRTAQFPPDGRRSESKGD